MSKTDQNAQVIDFLNYYFKLASPQYAVMLQAPWGAGKTWFIKEYIKTLPADSKPIYVTLNGVSSKAEIEEQFFEQMHPFLAHKATKIGAKVLKSFLRGTIKLDFDGDGKSDGTATVGTPDVSIKDFFSKSQDGSILVFDDVERCELPMHQLLGYINYFVEHDDARVILLANEEEIIAKEKRENPSSNTKEENQYLRVREKLIGKTFAIHPILNNALDNFLEEIVDGNTKKILKQESSLIADLHETSKSGNLRHLRQAILDFERIVQAINPDTRNSDMLRGILAAFLIYTFEVRSGNMQPEQIRNFDSWSTLLNGDKQDIKQKLQVKYPQLEMLESVFPEDLWANIMDSGLMDQAAMTTAIAQSKYYAKEEERPDWLRLNEAFSMEDADLATLINQVLNRLKNRDYKILGELTHVTGSLISLASIGVGSHSVANILAMSISNVHELKNKGLLLSADEDEQLFGTTRWAGRRFHGLEDSDFINFLSNVDSIKTDAKRALYPKKAEELLKLLHNKDAEGFAKLLSWSRGNPGKYLHEPVLSFIDPKDFVDVIKHLSAPQLSFIGRAIQSRYEDNREDLKLEKVWLDNVENLMKPLVKIKGSMSDYYRNVLRETISSARDKFLN